MSLTRSTLILVICILFVCGCAVAEKKYAHLSNDELTLVVVKKSYFDPDGFSREYAGELFLRLENRCEESIRNNLSIVCQQGDDFSLPQIYANDCTNGVVRFNNLNEELVVSFTGLNYPCKYFSHNYPFSVNE